MSPKKSQSFQKEALAPPLFRELSPALLEPNALSGTNHQIPAVLMVEGQGPMGLANPNIGDLEDHTT